MNTSKRHLAPLAVLAAALIAAGAAYAAGKLHSSSSPAGTSGPLAGTLIASGSAATAHGGGPGPGGRHGHGDGLAAAATYLGLTQAELQTRLQARKTLAQIADATSGKSAAGLIDALVTAEKAELAAAVTGGRLTQAQADRIASTLTAHVTAAVNGTMPAHGPGGPGHRPGGDDFAAAATYLGLTPAELQTQLQAGKTLAQLADATSGKSAAGLVDALVAQEKTELAAAVTAGRLTQAQADQIATTLKARFTALASGTRPPGDDGHGPGPGGPGFRHGGMMGPPPSGSLQMPGTHI